MIATFFATQAEFRQWLEKNHADKTELIVGYYKVNSGRPSMTWSQSVDQALCYGWIDGVRRSIDEASYCIRFTPRKKTSIWSPINIKKVEVLTKAGLMMPEGLKAFSFRTATSSEIYSYVKDHVALTAAYEQLFTDNKAAWAFFSAQAPSYKKAIIHWIMGAKQENTRLLRLGKAIDASQQQKRMR